GVWPQRDQRPQTQDAGLSGLTGQNAKDQWVSPEEGIDPGMMLDGHDIQPLVIAQHKLVQGLLEQVGSDVRIAVLVRQADADRIRVVKYLLGPEGIGVPVVKPNIHGLFLPSLSSDYWSKNAATRSTKASGCSISGWCPASAMSSKRAPGIKAL